MSNKKPDVIALRSVRKVSHLSGRVANKTARFLGRVEGKAGRLIESKGGPNGAAGITIDEFFYNKYPYLFPIHPALPTLKQRPSVTVFVPSLTPRGFFGGIATLLITSAALAQKLGYDYRVVQTSGFDKKTNVLEFLAGHGITIDEDKFSTIDVSHRNVGHYAYLPLHPEDVIVVSAWWDAYTASRLPLAKKFVYMLQDYEPIFYNNGDEQQFAEGTYHSEKFIPLCNTKLMYKYFSSNGYEYIKDNASWFEPAFDLKPDLKKQTSDTKTLFLYGRPGVERNMFYTAIQAIDAALQSKELFGSNWNVYCAGQSDIPNIKLKSGVTIKNLGKMDIEKYYDFAKSVDVAVSPMLAPHPNYPTLEFAALGSKVVTTSWQTKQDLSSYSSNILMAKPSVEAMTEKIIQAATNKSSSRANNIDDNWLAALEKPLTEIKKKLST